MSDETAPTTTRRRETTRQRLLDAAAQVFAEVGLEAASVEAVCERAGYTRGAFYSNFDTKEELFLELCTRRAQQQIAAVRERVARFEAEGGSGDPGDLVQQVLEVAAEDRSGVLLLGEIRLHALRNPVLASAYLAQEHELASSVGQIVADIARAKNIPLRVAPDSAARLLLSAWTTASERAVMAGLDADAMRAALAEALSEAARLVLSHDG
jgi:AcrR family transcriptional regulator